MDRFLFASVENAAENQIISLRPLSLKEAFSSSDPYKIWLIQKVPRTYQAFRLNYVFSIKAYGV